MKKSFRLQGENIDLDLSHQGDVVQITYAGRTIEARLVEQSGDAFTFEIREQGSDRWRQLQAAGVSLDSKKRHLWVAGRHLMYEKLPPQGSQPDAAALSVGSLSASIPSVVSEVLVAVGDPVEANAKLILLESMKMVIPILAPYAGTVRQINCAPGDAVEPGVPLLEIEQEES
jgi:biotin carboxyl carrier protein